MWLLLLATCGLIFGRGFAYSTVPHRESCDASFVMAIQSTPELMRLDQVNGQVSAFTHESDLRNPIAITTDEQRGLVFFTDVDRKKIYRTDYRHGTGTSVIINLDSSSVPDGIACDPLQQRIFYTDYGLSLIASMNYSGGNHDIILDTTDGMHWPRAILLDPQQRVMYYTDWGYVDHISRANYDGTNVTVLADTNLQYPNGLAADFTEGYLYWCDAGTDSVSMMRLDGSERRTLFSHPGSHFFDIFIFKQYLYLSDWETESVMRIPVNGGELENVYTDALRISGIRPICFPHVLDPTSRPMFPRTPSRTTTTLIIQSSPHLQIRSGSIIMAVQNWDGLVRMDLETREASPFTTDTDLSNPIAIATDQARGLVFFTDVSLKRIYRTDYKSSVVTQEIKVLDSSSVPDGIACDPLQQRIFYTDYGLSLIASMDYSGGNHHVILDQEHNLHKPRAILLDLDQRMMYYSDWGNSEHISRADYNGTNITILAETDLHYPNGLTADFAAGYLYWCDAGTDSVSVMRLDGSERRTLFSHPGSHFFDIILVQDFLYISDWSAKSLVRVSKEGGRVETIYSSNNRISGIHHIDLPWNHGTPTAFIPYGTEYSTQAYIMTNIATVTSSLPSVPSVTTADSSSPSMHSTSASRSTVVDTHINTSPFKHFDSHQSSEINQTLPEQGTPAVFASSTGLPLLHSTTINLSTKPITSENTEYSESPDASSPSKGKNSTVLPDYIVARSRRPHWLSIVTFILLLALILTLTICYIRYQCKRRKGYKLLNNNVSYEANSQLMRFERNSQAGSDWASMEPNSRTGSQVQLVDSQI